MATGSTGTSGLAQVTSLGDLFAWRVARTPQAEAYREWSAATGDWISHSWAQAAERIETWRKALAAMHLPAGARVAILLPNGVNAVCIDQASLALGLVPVPMHAIDNPASIAYIVRDSDASVLVISTRAQWNAIAAVGDGFTQLRQVVVTAEEFSSTDVSDAPGGAAIISLSTWLAGGAAQTAPRQAVSEDALAAIVYTSGTTGKPKGVMLTHRNVMSNIKAALAHVAVVQADVFLSFLPLSHTFERTLGYYLPIAAGSCVAYARSIAQIPEDLKAVRPTVLVSVPRIYERLYAKLQETLARSGRVTQSLFASTQSIGWRQFCRRQHIPGNAGRSTWLDGILDLVLHRLVARKVLAQFGGRLRLAVCGGAPLSQSVAQCLIGLGLPLLQGYGMTETSPVVSANTLADNWPATVGKTPDGIEVRIGDSQELQVRGNCVMQGYWKRPEDTARAMTDDGWLRTGDQAVIEDGRIRIVGRLKEIIVTSTGEKIAPADLELAITADPLFEQAFVIGENRPFIAAFVVLNRPAWEKFAMQLDLDPDAADLRSDTVRAALLEKIQRAAGSFPSYAVPRAVRAALEPWSIQNGLMTPTLKLKRNALLGFFIDEIADIYLKRPVQ